MKLGSKDTNPKDAVGVRKAPLTTLPLPVVLEVGSAMLEGARKYGRHNYRVAGVRASVYIDGAFRHLAGYWEGQDIDPDSGYHEITKAIASLFVLRDAMIQGKCIDDRPPRSPEGWLQEINEGASEIIDRHPEPKEVYLEGDQHPKTGRDVFHPHPFFRPVEEGEFNGS